MDFINPITLFNLIDIDFTRIDQVLIKKNRRKINAELELSGNGFLQFNGNDITKSDIERIADELEDPNKRRYYYSIAKNYKLNDFLSNGNENFFNPYQIEDIYQDKGFLDFISPFFATQYDRSLLKQYKNKNFNTFSKIVIVTPLVNTEYYDTAFQSLMSSIHKSISELEEFNSKIINEKINIVHSLEFIKYEFDQEYINLLPNYFQIIRNEIVNTIRKISLNINNLYRNAEIAYNISNYVNGFNIDGLIKRKIEEDIKNLFELVTIRPNYSINHEEKYQAILAGVKSRIDLIEKKQIYPLNVRAWINENIDLLQINVPYDSLNGFRNELALLLRTLAISIWNKFEGIDSAIEIIEKANGIFAINNSNKRMILDSRQELLLIKKNIVYNHNIKNTSSLSNEPETVPFYKDVKNILTKYWKLLVPLTIVIIGIIITIISPNKNNTNTDVNNNNGSLEKNNSYDHSQPITPLPGSTNNDPLQLDNSNHQQNYSYDNSQPKTTQPNSTSYDTSLLHEINTAKSNLSSMEKDLFRLNNLLNSYELQINAIKISLDEMKRKNVNGQYVDEAYYNSEVQRYNSLINDYNSTLSLSTTKYNQYKILLDDTRNKIADYNQHISN